MTSDDHTPEHVPSKQLARHVEITGTDVIIDGQSFPWYIAPRGPMVQHGDDETFGVVLIPVLVDLQLSPHRGHIDVTFEAAQRMTGRDGAS